MIEVPVLSAGGGPVVQWGYKEPVAGARLVVRTVDRHTGLLDASDLLEAAALDRYQFLRAALLETSLAQSPQRRIDATALPERRDF